MIDLEKEREAFESCVNTGATIYLHSVDSYEGITKWVGENPVIRAVSGWDAWKKCAVSKQQEIESLKAQLAQYQSDDYVLFPKMPHPHVFECGFTRFVDLDPDYELDDLIGAWLKMIEAQKEVEKYET